MVAHVGWRFFGLPVFALPVLRLHVGHLAVVVVKDDVRLDVVGREVFLPACALTIFYHGAIVGMVTLLWTFVADVGFALGQPVGIAEGEQRLTETFGAKVVAYVAE